MLKYIRYKTVNNNSSKLIRKRTSWKTNIQKQPPSCVLYNKVFLTFSQNSLENNCFGALSCRPETFSFIKKRLRLRCFSINFAKFLRSLFYRTPPVAAFETFYLRVLIMKYK